MLVKHERTEVGNTEVTNFISVMTSWSPPASWALQRPEAHTCPHGSQWGGEQKDGAPRPAVPVSGLRLRGATEHCRVQGGPRQPLTPGKTARPPRLSSFCLWTPERGCGSGSSPSSKRGKKGKVGEVNYCSQVSPRCTFQLDRPAKGNEE